MEDHLNRETMQQVVERWREQDPAMVVHLLGCELCRALALEILGRPWEEGEDLGSGLADGPLLLPMEMTVWATQALALYEELKGLEAPRRREVIREARFRNLLLADLLLADGERLALTEPQRAEELASLAFGLAGSRYPKSMAAWIDEVVARSCCLLGNARRLAGDLEGARTRFDWALAALTMPPDSPVRALYCRMLALLHEDQGRELEAEMLLWRAAGIYRDLGRREAQGECLCRLGFLFLKGHDLHKAASALVHAWLLLSETGSADAARAGLGLAVCLAAMAQRGPARRLLEESRELREAFGREPGELVRLDWLEGRIEAHLGDLATAVPRLEGVRRRLMEEEKLLEAALCTVDLACAYAKAGRAEEILRLAHEIAARFPGSLGLTRALVAFCRLLRSASEGNGDLEAAAREASELIRRPEAWLELPPPEEN